MMIQAINFAFLVIILVLLVQVIHHVQAVQLIELPMEAIALALVLFIRTVRI